MEWCSITGGLLAFLIVLVTIVLWNWWQLVSIVRRCKLKGPTIYPLIGCRMTMDMYKNELEFTKKYGRVYMTVLGNWLNISVSDLEVLKKIFVKDFHHFQNRLSVDGIDPWPTDKMLLNLKDDDWKRVRSIVTPTFSAGKLKLMMAELNYCASNLTESLLEQANEDKVVDVKDLFGCYTMDVIAGTAFGLRTDSYKNPDNRFINLAQKVFNQDVLKNPFLLLLFFCQPLVQLLAKCGVSLFYPKDSLKFFVELIGKIIENRKDTEDHADEYRYLGLTFIIFLFKTKRVDFLQLLMNAESEEGSDTKKKLDMGELLGQGFIFFIAGYETTNTLLQFASYVLATKPDIQDKLLEEVDSLGDADPTYDSVTELKYMDLFISECLRMYPPLCRMNRMSSPDGDVEIDGYVFPKNTGIMFSIYQIHHDPENYPDPEEFIPERFSPERRNTIHPIAYLPFGYGPRNCVGLRLALLEAKIALFHVLRRLKFVTCPETDIPVKIHQETFLRLKSPIKVKVELRQ